MNDWGPLRVLRLATALIAAFVALSCASAPAPTTAAATPTSQDQQATEQQVMVTYPPAPPAIWAQTTAELVQIYRLRVVYSWTMASLGEQCVVFEVPHGKPVQDFVRRISSYPRVGTVQPVETFQTQGWNDPYARLQHNAQAIHVEQAHHMATGKGVRIAVVDTGVDLDHPDLRGQIVRARSFVNRGDQTFTTDIHGTAVAGLIAAAANNDIGIVGVAPGAEIYAIKACWQQPPGAREAICNSYTLALAVDYAITQGVQVLNLSLAGPQDPILGRLIGQALAKGIVVVAADGGSPARDFPASYQGVIGILGSDDLKPGAAPTSDHPLSTLAAPAVDILTTVPHGSYDFFSGSSLAAAQVSGIAALMLEKNPRLTPAQLASVIRKTAHPLAAGPVVQVDACAAVASVAGGGACG
jgi:subtilisin family serine protease